MSSKNVLGNLSEKSSVHRLSVRGAFGPQGSLFKGRRNSATQINRAQAFQLDKCLDKKALDKVIYQMTNTKDTIQQARRTGGAGQGAYEYNVDGFAQFLSAQKALGSLLFWKDAEEYAMIFGVDERKQYAKKIYDRYLKEGAEYEVTVTAEMRKKIKEEMDDPPEELFEDAQGGVYQLMLFELFPRFYEECRELEGAEVRKSSLTKDTELATILKQTDNMEVHFFADYCREIMCEDQIIFLMEVGDFRLLFSPQDQLDAAKKIYAMYLDKTSETRITAGDDELSRISKAIQDATKDTKVGLSLNMFDKLYNEVFNLLNMETWPTYKEHVLKGGTLKEIRTTLSAASAPDPQGGGVDMSTPSKKAVAAALRMPDHLDAMQAAAAAQGTKEQVDFCVACQQYALLFSEADRKPKGETIWKTFLAAGADTPVNLPDYMIGKMKPKYLKGDSDAFDAGYNELLQVLSDNIYAHYLREMMKKQQAAAPPPAAPAPAELPKTGGCCLIS